MPPRSNFMIYGSYGYTGELITQLAVERGLKPILAGRNTARLHRQAQEFDLETFAFSLDQPSEVDAALSGVQAVLHCAGPFALTAGPMVESCLRTGTHYLDITGEIAVFEALARRSDQARERGVMLLPGSGFDVVPSDCLAAHLKERLPGASRLTLAIRSLTHSSRGTARTAIQNIGQPSMIRKDGRLLPIPAGSRTLEVDFGRGPRTGVAVAWGDLSTAFYSTGIPNIEVYMTFPASFRRMMKKSQDYSRLLSSAPVQSVLRLLLLTQPAGPNEAQRQSGHGILWGEVADEEGHSARARLHTPEPYALTALVALAAIEKVLAGQAPAGFQTPSLAFGADFILEIEGCQRQDLA